jgi:hypothetical protein
MTPDVGPDVTIIRRIILDIKAESRFWASLLRSNLHRDMDWHMEA